MGSSAVTLDLSKSQPIGSGVMLDLSQSQPLNAPQQTDAELNAAGQLHNPAMQAIGDWLGNRIHAAVQGFADTNQPLQQQVMQNLAPHSALSQQYGTAAGMAAPAATTGAFAASLPNAKAAGAALGAVEDAIGHLPVDIAAPMQAAQRSAQLAERGSKPVKVISDFLDRMSPKMEGEVATSIPSRMTFQEARDFYSNARNLTREELGSLKGKQIDAVVNFANSLGDSLNQTAKAGGQAAQYSAAMKDYAQAKTLGDVIDAAKKWGIPASIGLIGGATLKSLYDASKAIIP